MNIDDPAIMLLQVMLGEVLYLLFDEVGDVFLFLLMVLLELLVFLKDGGEHTIIVNDQLNDWYEGVAA